MKTVIKTLKLLNGNCAIFFPKAYVNKCRVSTSLDDILYLVRAKWANVNVMLDGGFGHWTKVNPLKNEIRKML